ncbi:hypothetical protein [Halomonas qaidamensis]|nr:hypothetical protein [Halomonas qaidamensis]
MRHPRQAAERRPSPLLSTSEGALTLTPRYKTCLFNALSSAW